MKSRLYFALFPRKCAACGKVTDWREYYCPGCREQMPFIGKERCEYCGEDKKSCTCKKHKHHYESIVAPFYYEQGAKHAVLKMKTYPIYAQVLAKECAKVIEDYYGSESFDFITSVPMSHARRKESGYNHSAVLAEEIAKLTGIPYCESLQVLFDVPAQHALGHTMRAGNVRGIYDVLENTDVKDKNILLVDDIKTTGATLNECALMLKLYGAGSVKAVCAALRKG